MVMEDFLRHLSASTDRTICGAVPVRFGYAFCRPLNSWYFNRLLTA